MDESSFTSVAVNAFAVFAIPVGFFSSLMAFVRWGRGDTPDRIDDGINWGIAVGFAPGTILGVAVFIVGLVHA